MILVENVPFLLRVDRGRALLPILERLEELGYRWVYRVVDSMAFGLPQRQERLFLLASLKDDPRAVLLVDDHEASRKVLLPTRKRPFGFYLTEGNHGLGAAVDAIPVVPRRFSYRSGR